MTVPDTREVAAVDVDPGDLPIFCPNPQMPLWSSHPKVFLDVAENGIARCPYCGTRYHVRGAPPGGGGH